MIDVNNQRLQWNELNIVQCVVFIACITCNYAINIIEMFTSIFFLVIFNSLFLILIIKNVNAYYKSLLFLIFIVS